MVDPLGDLSDSYYLYSKIKMARAKIVLICTQKPARIIRALILSGYWNVKCLNSILVYQDQNDIHVYTINPFLSHGQSIELNYTDDYFYDKLRDVNQYEVNALFTYEDKTKAGSKMKGNGLIYFGKDYEAIRIIFSHINAKLRILDVDSLLLDNEVNPWINSNWHVNRLGVKRRIMTENNISVIIQSQPFVADDQVTENVYPHAQDDDCILVLKGKELGFHHQLINIFSVQGWTFFFAAALGKDK